MLEERTVLEICAGAGGQALGLEAAGWHHGAAIDNDVSACETLRVNRPSWNVLEQDVATVDGKEFRGVGLLAGGVPCPPFSVAGSQLGALDERDLFPQAVRLISEAEPQAVLLENVRGFAAKRFKSYRKWLLRELGRLGYDADWRLLTSSDFGVPQLRPRFVLVALRPHISAHFSWPEPNGNAPTVGEAIGELMAAAGWPGAKAWAKQANSVAPTIVGGSKKHGGPDLGPTRAREAWRALGVDGLGLADAPPSPDHGLDILPRLTVRMVARLQGFPDNWEFSGKKTAAYRQVGNAFPPPVAKAVGKSILEALSIAQGLERESFPVQRRLLEESPRYEAAHA